MSNGIAFHFNKDDFSHVPAPRGHVGFGSSYSASSHSKTSYSNSYSSYSSGPLARQINDSSRTRINGNFTGNSKLFT